ncbi:CYTH domain-containing protein [Nocardioides montaniterrae]
MGAESAEVSLKYAHLESERRFLLRSLPASVAGSMTISDLYVDGTRLRLREVVEDGVVVRKLGQKIRLGDVTRIAHTTLYLDDAEWALLSTLPGRRLTKVRHRTVDPTVAVDVFPDGTIVAEVDGGSALPEDVPAWLDVVREVTYDERFCGGGRAIK